MKKTIEIPEGYEARIEGNKVIFERKSKDEQTRQELLFFIKDEKEHTPETTPGEHWDRWIAYLERQKEQKPVMIQWTGNNLKEVIDFTGKSPRFGEWFKSWEEYENYVHTHKDILKLFCADGSHYEVPVGAWIVKTPDGFNIPSLFKFIQKPAKWSEEDEKMLASFLHKVEVCDLLTNKENVWIVKRLKALRPQPHWKPSEEQMWALDVALENFYDQNDKAALNSLKIDLQKL